MLSKSTVSLTVHKRIKLQKSNCDNAVEWSNLGKLVVVGTINAKQQIVWIDENGFGRPFCLDKEYFDLFIDNKGDFVDI